MIANVTSPQSASTAILTASRQGHRLAARMPVAIGEHQAQHDQRRRPNKSPGATPAMNRLMDRDRAAGRERIDDCIVARRDEQCLYRGADRHIGGEDARVAGLSPSAGSSPNRSPRCRPPPSPRCRSRNVVASTLTAERPARGCGRARPAHWRRPPAVAPCRPRPLSRRRAQKNGLYGQHRELAGRRSTPAA